MKEDISRRRLLPNRVFMEASLNSNLTFASKGDITTALQQVVSSDTGVLFITTSDCGHRVGNVEPCTNTARTPTSKLRLGNLFLGLQARAVFSKPYELCGQPPNLQSAL